MRLTASYPVSVGVRQLIFRNAQPGPVREQAARSLVFGVCNPRTTLNARVNRVAWPSPPFNPNAFQALIVFSFQSPGNDPLLLRIAIIVLITRSSQPAVFVPTESDLCGVEAYQVLPPEAALKRSTPFKRRQQKKAKPNCPLIEPVTNSCQRTHWEPGEIRRCHCKLKPTELDTGFKVSGSGVYHNTIRLCDVVENAWKRSGLASFRVL